MVLKSIYASGSTGPLFADHYLNIWIDSTQVSPRKTDFLSRYLALSEIRYARKRNWSKTRNGIFCQKFSNLLEIFEITEQELLLDSLLSAWTFVYWNMEVLLELLIIEIIFLQSKFTQSAQLLDVFFKIGPIGLTKFWLQEYYFYDQ